MNSNEMLCTAMVTIIIIIGILAIHNIDIIVNILNIENTQHIETSLWNTGITFINSYKLSIALIIISYAILVFTILFLLTYKKNAISSPAKDTS